MIISHRQLRLLQIAKKTAIDSFATQFKFGVVLANKSNILSSGTNNPGKTHPKSLTTGQLHHAEFSAIINARTNLSGADMYIWRSGKGQKPLLARPCNCCMNLIRKTGIKRIFYSTENGINKELV